MRPPRPPRGSPRPLGTLLLLALCCAHSSEEEREAPARPPAAPHPPAAPRSAPWPFRLEPVQLRVDVGGAGVPLVVVPVPVPYPTGGCDAGSASGHHEELPHGRRPPPAPPARRPPPAAAPAPALDEYDDERPPRPARPARPAARDPPPHQEVDVHEQAESVKPPRLQSIFTSQELVEEFRAQTASAPELPPMLLSEFDASERAPLPAADALPDPSAPPAPPAAPAPPSAPAAPAPPAPYPPKGAARGRERERDPPRPRFDNLPLMRAQLTVHRADYSEPYTVWFDQDSGNARVDYHGGATSTFRTHQSDGRVRRAEVRIVRSAGGAARRCAVAAAPAAPADRLHPALPDLQQFSFAAYEDGPGGRVEVWRRVAAGRAGEQGGARGEALSATHELRLARTAADTALPLRYSVSVDSSALGARSDGYEHFYEYDTPQPLDDKFFDVDLDKLCDQVEYLNASAAEDGARLDPLREFTAPRRDPRHDDNYESYKQKYERTYADEKEEAVRKNVLMQSTRFVAAGNRQGATSELGAGLLADRLGAELRALQGAEAERERAPGEAFPHARADLRSMERRLPSGFDWRPRGGVSPVRFQGAACASCWAFAVAGAVEGALFRRTRSLVPLSEQCLVDCAQPYGGKGCKGTWPSHAFNYVEARGLPALDEYPAYKEKVGQCVDESVPSQTRISAHVNVTANSVPALKVAIRRHAPTVVIVDADCKSFVFHKKGVLYDDRCGKALRQLHHAVLAVGWGERQGEPHFILKNSWSAAWGEAGYVRVHARSNACGVLTKPSYPRLEDPDVAQPLRRGASAPRPTRPARPARGSAPADDYSDY